MAQIIKHRRGSISNVGTLSPVNPGEIILGTGSVGSLNGPVLFVGDSSSYKAVPQLYYGSSVPNISTYSQLDGVSFYDTTGKNLYILQSSGSNQRLDLAGSVSGSTITPAVVSASYVSVDTNLSASVVTASYASIGHAILSNLVMGGYISSNLFPEHDNMYSLGSTGSYWSGVYATTGAFVTASGYFTGSFAGDGSQLTGIATNLVVYSDGNISQSINLKTQNLKVLGTTNEINTAISLNSGSDGYTVQIGLPDDVTIAQKLTVSGALEVTGSSYIHDLHAHSGSFDHKVTIGQDLEVTGSAFFQNNISASSGWFSGSVTVGGNLTVNGTSTIVNSTTVEIGDNIISLNGTGATNAGLVVKDPTSPYTVSGSLLWDSSNDYWIAGPLGTEKRIATLNANTLTTNALLYGNSTSQIVSMTAPSGSGEIAQWNGSAWTMSNVIDGGTF
jgi:hypothetical protein